MSAPTPANALEAASEGSEWQLPAAVTTPVVVLPLILLAVAAVFGPAIPFWFHTDDLLLLRAARVVPFWTYVPEAFDFRDFEPLQLYAYRPLYFVSSAAMYHAFGLNPAPYHAANLALHLLNVVLVYWIAHRLTGSRAVGYIAAAIFGLHPAYAVTVAWISGLNSLAATTGQLACIAMLIQYYAQQKPYWLAAAFMSYLASIGFHQEVFAAPFLFIAYTAADCRMGGGRLLSRNIILPSALFGGALMLFLTVQGQNSRESGFIDLFRPDAGFLAALYGVLSTSAYPDGALASTPRDLGIAIVALSLLAFVMSVRPQYALLLGFMLLWFFASLALSILFLDDAPKELLKGVLSRKIYAAGPAWAIGAAVVLSVLWDLLAQRAHRLALTLTALALALAAVAFAFIEVGATLDEERDRANASEQFYLALSAEFPDLEPGTTLYVAGTPFILMLWNCVPEVSAPHTVAGSDTKPICFLSSLVAIRFGDDVNVVPVSIAQARDAAFLDQLQPTERVFCYSCGQASP
jgi:hypothetical protein